jgi:hypothetical protein
MRTIDPPAECFTVGAIDRDNRLAMRAGESFSIARVTPSQAIAVADKEEAA